MVQECEPLPAFSLCFSRVGVKRMRIETALLLGMLFSCFSGGCSGTVSDCVPNQSSECADDQVYWVDSCGNRGEVRELCACGCEPDVSSCRLDCQDPCEAVVCDQPPADACTDASTRRTWLIPGTCSDGQCSYEAQDQVCEDGCLAGTCIGDPCAGVTCSQPPQPLCLDAGLMRTYEQAGQCEDGACVYPYQDDSCSDCCYGAEINPSGDPIGGGPGYRALFDPASAGWVVGDTAGLLAAMDGVLSGEIIYIEDEAAIDLTGYDDIQVPAGVTLASGRGRAGSLGGIIWTAQFDAFPLFMAAGDNVRFSGLRILGPDLDVGDHDYQNPELSRGLQTGSAGLEVDNCDLAGFGHAAVVVYGQEAEASVHHCHIHNNTRAGLGYGVVLDRSACLIEANLFDANRHSIAGTGRPGTRYEARYNLVLAHATGHYFDMHGAADFDKRISSAIWRFDEGAGEQAQDSSVYNSNHCSLQSMDSAAAWVAGQIETGLVFDGLDDHLDCGNDPSLQSATGSIEFWLRADRLGQEQELIDLFEDDNQNYLSVRLTASNQIGVLILDDGLQLLDRLSDEALSVGVLKHVVITQDGTGIKIYLDGQAAAVSGSDAGAWSEPFALTGLWIGAGHRSAFQGMLDEVRIYSRALEPEEVQRHFLGQADIAGDSILIHHNTFRGADMSAVVIRGKPAEPSSIHHNWFQDLLVDHAVRQTNALGNLEVVSNHLGPQMPLGTRLPSAVGTATPDSGQAPLQVSFDASASYSSQDGPAIVNWRWDFGDGETGWGESVVHTYGSGGRYGVDLTVFDAKGATAHAFIPVLVSPGPGYLLDFWVKDSYRGALTGYYVSQALVDGDVVWEEDLADSWGWRHVLLDVSAQVSGKQSTEISFRVLNQTAVLNGELIEASVYFDDVFLFGADQAGGDFEGPSTWAYRESTPDWSGSAHCEEARSGWRSFRIHYPYSRDCPQGAHASISQAVLLLSEHSLAEWRLDEGQGEWAEDRSLFDHHGSLVNMDAGSWVAGVMGKALAFDGTDQRVECAFSPSMQSAQGRIDFWLSAEAGSTGTILSLVEDDQNYFSIELAAGGLIRVQKLAGGVAQLDLQSASGIDDGAFHHLAVVQDGSQARVYVDGQGGESGLNGPAWTDGLLLSGVQLGAGPQGFFSGVLDELRLDDRPADAAWAQQQFERAHPLALWHFDEGAGQTASDGVGDHDAGLQGMDPAVAWIEGVAGGGLWFDGQDDYLDFANAAGLGSAQGSLEFWFRAERFDENQDLFNLFEDGYQNYFLVRLNESNRITLRIEDHDAGLVNLTADVPVLDSDFHHLALTQDGFGIRIYIDGVEARASGDNGQAWTGHLALTGLWLARGHWSWFKGAMDELALFARALRPGEIAEHASP